MVERRIGAALKLVIKWDRVDLVGTILARLDRLEERPVGQSTAVMGGLHLALAMHR